MDAHTNPIGTILAAFILGTCIFVLSVVFIRRALQGLHPAWTLVAVAQLSIVCTWAIATTADSLVGHFQDLWLYFVRPCVLDLSYNVGHTTGRLLAEFVQSFRGFLMLLDTIQSMFY